MMASKPQAHEGALSELVNVNWSEPKITSNQNCCVPQCSNRGRLGQISLHCFPSVGKPEHTAWVTKLRIGKEISKCMRVCSEHFNDEDFHPTWLPDQRRILRTGAVPSMKLPVRSTDKVLSPEEEEKKLARSIRNQKRSRSSAQISPNKTSSCVSKENNGPAVTSTPLAKRSVPWQNLWNLELSELNSLSESDPDITEINLSAPSEPNQDGSQTVTPEMLEESRPASAEIGIQCDSATHADKNIQVNASYDLLNDINGIKFCLTELLVNNKKLNVYTGIASLATLDIIEEEVIVAGARPMYHMTVRDMIVLVLIRLKLNISFIALSTLFSLSDSGLSRVFGYCLPFLSYVLRTLIVWPDKEILKNIPKCFAKFSKVRVVLDCTEIHTEKSKCLQCRLKTYSNYKGAHTVKFLIGVSPAGLITSVSKPFGGRASDKAIFQQSDLLEKLEPYVDEVMVDKGFNIDDECANIGVNLLRPPFLRKAKQFSKGDSIRTVEIAKARVHVERAIQRIKVFGILSSRLNWEMLNYIDHIMLIVCGIVNLGPPILSNERF